MFRIIMLAAMAACSVTAHASSWKVFSSYSETSVFFFDSDTLDKKGDTVTIWIKIVREANSPDTDGSYSTAQRVVYSCKKRTVKILTTSLYDKSQKFMRTYSNPTSKEEDIIPDSIGEGILKEVCSNDFPKGKGAINDIYTFANNYFEYLKNAKADPAPK